MRIVTKKTRGLLFVFSLVMLLCSHATSFSVEDQAQEEWYHAGEFTLNDLEKQYIQMNPEETFAYIPHEVLVPLAFALAKNNLTLANPSFSHVSEVLTKGLRISRYSDMEKVVGGLDEPSLSTYKQQLKTGDALINLIFDQPVTKKGCCKPKSCSPKASCKPGCSPKAASCKLILSQPGLTALQVLQIIAALQSLQGEDGELVLQGLQGLPGLDGLMGIQGLQGIIGLTGIPGIQGIQGIQGTVGLQGIQGPAGTNGLDGVVTSAQYVQLGSQPATVGGSTVAEPFTYTTAVLTTPNIIATTAIFNPPFTISGTVFELVNVGRYEINYQMTYPTPSGVVLHLGATIPTMLPLPYTMIGKDVTDTGGQVSGSVVIETTTPSSFLAVCAAAGNTSAIGIPPNSSTTNMSATTVSIKQIA